VFALNIDEELSLELINPLHADALAKLIDLDREYLSQWLAWPPFINSENDYLGFVKRSLHEHAEGTTLVCAVIFQGKPVGTAGFVDINNNLKKAEIGYWLAANVQGKGIITRVCNKLTEIAFNDLKLDKVGISVATENFASQRVCERLGMVVEGIVKNEERIGDRILDHKKYALMRPC